MSRICQVCLGLVKYMDCKQWYMNPVKIQIFATFEKLLSILCVRAGVVNFFCKRSDSKYFKFCRAVSITTTQLCHCSVKIAIDN